MVKKLWFNLFWAIPLLFLSIYLFTFIPNVIEPTRAISENIVYRYYYIKEDRTYIPTPEFKDLNFKSSDLRFDISCSHPIEGAISVGNPSDECWYSNILYKEEQYPEDEKEKANITIHHNEELKLDDCISVKMSASGKVYFGLQSVKVFNNVIGEEKEIRLNGQTRRPTDTSIIYFFTIEDECFNAKIVEGKSNIILNSDKKIPIKITQKFTNKVLDGGIYWQETRKGLFYQATHYTDFRIFTGEFIYSQVSLPTKWLRKIIIDITAYIKINIPRRGKVFLYGTEDSFEYNIIAKENICSSKEDCFANEICLENTCQLGIGTRIIDGETTIEQDIKRPIPLRIIVLISLTVLFLIGLVIYFSLRGKYGKKEK